MEPFFHAVNWVVSNAAKTTGQQALTVHHELPVSRGSADDATSRVRDNRETTPGCIVTSVSPHYEKTSKTTGPPGSVGNQGELYGGISID